MKSTNRRLPLFFAAALLGLTGAAVADLGNGNGTPVRARPSQSSVDGVVSNVQGAIVSILGGNVSIDVTNAKIVGAGDVGHGSDDATGPDAANPAITIGVGMHLSASVDVPQAGAVAGPALALVARFVVVTPHRDGTIVGDVQSLDKAHGTLTVLNETIKTDSQTVFKGSDLTGAVSKLDDVATGQHVAASVIVSGGDLVATRLEIFPGVRSDTLVTFTGIVESMDTGSWQIGGRAVVVNGDTKVSGSPQKGDTVQVLARQDPSNALVALAITRLGIVPPPGAKFEFHGVVQSIPVGGTGDWKISGRVVTVNASTVIEGSPAVGDDVDVQGFMQMTVGGPAVLPSFQLVATKIEKSSSGAPRGIDLD